MARSPRRPAAVAPAKAASPLLVRAPALRALRVLMSRGGPGATRIFIAGEAGSGRSHWAAHWHELGPGGPLVIADCALLNSELFEAQLFGVAAGAATGVSVQPGWVGRARGGTLIFDRIELLDFALQAKLLRLLDRGEYQPLGGAPEQAALRIGAIYTLDGDPGGADGVPAGLRPDLYFRLSGFKLQLPPLRERREELRAFAAEFLRRLGRPAAALKPAALLALLRHPLPGNLRELEAVLSAAHVAAGAQRIDLKHLPADYRTAGPRAARGSAPAENRAPFPRLEEVVRRHVLRALAEAGGNRSRAALLLGISRKSLWERLARWQAEGGPDLAALENPAADGDDGDA